jgi:sulfoxide reductase heme-binding subunit YedZ
MKIAIPWQDRKGRFSWLKAVTLALALAPGLWLAAQWIGGDLGPRALNAAIHGTGRWAVRFLLISLAVTPARYVLDWPKIVLVRRMLGLTALAYAVIHLSLFAADQGWNPLTVATEIAKRFYLLIGFTALLGLIALGVTSTDKIVARMGRNWKKLHKAVYGIAILALLHHFMQAKADTGPAVLVATLYVWLMLQRQLPGPWRQSVPAYLALALAACACGMLIEFAWYGIATHIDPWRVFWLNFSTAYGIRPAVWGGIACLAAVPPVAWRRLRQRFPAAMRAAE